MMWPTIKLFKILDQFTCVLWVFFTILYAYNLLAVYFMDFANLPLIANYIFSTKIMYPSYDPCTFHTGEMTMYNSTSSKLAPVICQICTILSQIVVCHKQFLQLMYGFVCKRPWLEGNTQGQWFLPKGWLSLALQILWSTVNKNSLTTIER